MNATHWRITYPNNLKRAYYITIGLTVLVLLAAFGYSKGRSILQSQQVAAVGSHIIAFDYYHLGAPPSLNGEQPFTPTTTHSSAPTVGIPHPVEDKNAVAVTSPTQADLVGVSPLVGVGPGTVVVRIDTSIPPPGTYTMHSVEPTLRHRETPNYPESARLLDIEGTVVAWQYINEKGEVMRVTIARSSGNAALDTAAAEASWKFVYSPALQGDRPIRVWLSQTFHFTLHQ